jgi:RNA polymerase sigma factor (sigma-70 family)
MLNQLSKKDLEWRKIALKICGNKYLADDLVNDMYLKIHKRNPTEFNKHYISYVIYGLFIDNLRKRKVYPTVYIEDINNFNSYNLDESTEDRNRINEALNELGLFDREILLHTHENSLRKASATLDMSYGKLNYQKHNALKKLKETETIKEWEYERT